MSDSQLQMVMASLEGLLERGIITIPQHQAALAAESSLSPVAWQRDFRGGRREMSDSALRMTLDRLEIRLVRKTFTFENYRKWMTVVFDEASYQAELAEIRKETSQQRKSQDQGESSQKAQESGDKSVVKSVVAEESVSVAVVIKSEVRKVSKVTKTIPRQRGCPRGSSRVMSSMRGL